ncbi:MAG: hypothetical protein L6R38_002358 [Xanthoria sp. 2 TBL-2021]|nr:MAG: hypothetical protein L6R38_002358 [Xanthoria sp. 2 TBL-2021]
MASIQGREVTVDSRKLGAMLPGTAKASAVLMRYLDQVIDKAVSMRDQEEEGELHRKQHTLLGSLLSQGVSVKVNTRQITHLYLPEFLKPSLPANQGFYDGDPDRRQGQKSALRPQDPHLRRWVVDFLRQDPGSITLVWAFYELASNPQIVKTLREKIEAT